jgi:hypothetical protein
LKKKTANVSMMTKKLAASLAMDLALREKKSDGGIAVRRGPTKGKKGK